MLTTSDWRNELYTSQVATGAYHCTVHMNMLTLLLLLPF